MGTRFGEIDVTQILENEFRIMVLERIVNRILQKCPTVRVNPGELEDIKKEVVAHLQEKYPNSGIGLEGPKP